MPRKDEVQEDPSADADEELKATLISTLHTMFQFEKQDLNFGIYRIINLKRREIGNFIEHDLFRIIEENISLPFENITPKNRRASYLEILQHLITFFERYYEAGDFISKRRYSKNQKYVIPYNGEENYLYWVNQDQYYIKTTEHFLTYAFKVDR